MATTQTPPRRPPTGRTPAAPPPPPGGKGRLGRRGRPARRRHPFWQGLLMLIQGLLILIFVAVIALLAFVFFSLRGAPSSIDLTFNPPGITKIYAADGTPLARLFVENRVVVPIERIPKDLQNATVAFEDKRFYQHPGADIQGIARAMLRNIKHGDLRGEGGSTITQQLARNMGVEGLTREKSVQRKLHELLVATQIEKSYTKSQILEMYLNQINYGQNAFGVQAAAQTYFGKDVNKLDLAQCALLAGLPNRPTVFNPYKDKNAAKLQRDIVLDNMAAQHYITPEQCAKAKAEYIHLAAPKPPKQGNQIFHAPFFVDYVVDQLKRKYGQDALLRGNMNVYTTLNLTMQEQAEKAVQSGIADAREHGATQGCLIALDPKTGEIRAMVGGTDYAKNQFNIVTQARRQPGSSFKAIVYAAAIDGGAYTEESRVYDAPVTFHAAGGKAYTPRDDSGYSYNHVSLKTAMAYSINVPAVKVLKDIGPQTAIFYAHKMGVEMDTPLAPVLSLALGSSEVSPLEMADVYATIASGGNRPVPTPLTRIADAANKTLEDVPPQVETRVLKPETAHQLDDMLRAVVTEPKGTGAGAIDVPEARGKTGTTQGHKDVWFIGYTPQLVCAVWAGHPVHNAKTGRDGDAEMEGGAWGGTVCVPIWKNFMLQALPVYKTVLAKEAARSRGTAVAPKPMPPLPTVTRLDGSDGSNSGDETDTYYNSRRYRRHHRRHTDTTNDSGAGPADTASPDAASPAVTDATDNADGTRAATVDNETGLLAPPGAPNSHRETFAPGATPNVMSPQYDGPSSGTSAGGTPADNGSLPRRRTRRRPSTGGDSTGGESAPPGDNSGDSPAPRPRRRASAPSRPRDQEYVTVRVNPNDGMLATKWTPQVVERRYPKGQEPHHYSSLDPPPPGER